MPRPVSPAEADEGAAPAVAKPASRPAPMLTGAIIATLAVIYALELHFSLTPGSPPGRTGLVALGAASGHLVLVQGEVWRLVTATLLHSNLPHIVGNVVVLFLAASTLERLIGRAWLAAVYVVSALAGSIVSICCNPAQSTTVGASGAIMGLLACAFVCSFHINAYDQRNRIRWVSLRILIPALVPFGSASGAAVDYSAHAGGLMAGAAMGFLLQILWPEDDQRPGHGRIAAGVGVFGAVLALVSFALVAATYPAYAAGGERYAPDGWLPHLQAPRGGVAAAPDPAAAQRLAELSQRFPHDLRLHALRADAFEKVHDLDGAEQELRAALAEHDALQQDFPPTAELRLRAALAGVLYQQRRSSEARAEAQPVCDAPSTDPVTEKMREALRKATLCE